MPTPVNTARQCLTQEAAAALEDAVSAAKKRGHSQTTSIHMVSSLLSNPSSNLREACTHARIHFGGGYTARAQLKALDLSVSVSLDRLPSSTKVEEPPVANSLMAAVKRSQAAQRRLPENFCYYQQQEKYCCNSSSPPGSSAPMVRVELKNLLVSILDDPLVSRVFAEAGFRSYDVKMALIRPGFGGYAASRYRRPSDNPPMFLCNFPFMGSLPGDEQNWKRTIGGIMVREKKRNPLILGVGASDVLGSFLQTMTKTDDDLKALFPQGLAVVNVKDEVLKLANEGSDHQRRLKLDEVETLVAKKHGVVLNFGDLEVLDSFTVDKLGFLVSDFRELLDLHRGKLWLIASVGSYDVYFKILNKVSNMDADLDLEILPTLRFSMGGSYPRSSLMESFVPLGGFFPTPSEMKSPVPARCRPSNDGFEREFPSLPRAVSQGHLSTLPLQLRGVESTPRSSASSSKGRDGDCDDRRKVNDVKDSSESPPSSHLFHNPVYNYVKDPKLLHKAVVDRVGHHHEDAVGTFLLAITQCRSRANRSHLWMSLKGSDGFVKKKLGLALAEALHGSAESFIYVDLSFELVSMRKKDSFLFKTLGVKNSYDVAMRGTAIDYLVENLSKRPSIVFLDHIDEADVVVQNGLLRAIETGRLADLNGREANIANSIFLCSHGCKDNLKDIGQQCSNKYTEEDLLEVKYCSVQIVIGYDLNDGPTSDVSHPFDVGEKGLFETNQINKRKLVGCNKTTYRDSFEASKRANKSANSYLDLNLPAEENENFTTSQVESDRSDSNTENSRSSWLEDLEGRVDSVAAFEPFDFASTAEKLRREMVRCLNDVAGASNKCSLEVERGVVLQIVAAAYLYGVKKVEDWIQSVVRQCFARVVGRFDPSCRTIVKIVACDGENVGEAGEGLLPARIINN